MARDTTVKDSHRAAVGLTLLLVTSFLNLCVCAPAKDWLSDPCHYRSDRQIRHSRDTNHSEHWKAQLKNTKIRFRHEMKTRIEDQYKKVSPFLKTCSSDLKRKVTEQSPLKYYEAIQDFAVMLDNRAEMKHPPMDVDFSPDNRREIFRYAVNITKQLLCEIYDTLPEDQRKSYALVARNRHRKDTEIPNQISNVYPRDYEILKCYDKFLNMSVNKIYGRKRGGKRKGGKRKGGKGKAKANKKKKVQQNRRKKQNQKKRTKRPS